MNDTQSIASHSPQRRQRPDPRRDATRQAIIEAAESLFARQGVDAISLRQIGAAIGAGNTAVVSYHFGDKEALIEAILRHRLPHFEKRRAELRLGLVNGKAGIVDVLRIIWQPLYEQRNAQGQRSYAGFLASLGRSQWAWVWSGSARDVPVTLELGEIVRRLMPEGAQRHYWERIVAASALITTALETIDKRDGADPDLQLALFEDAMRMAAAALSAPAG